LALLHKLFPKRFLRDLWIYISFPSQHISATKQHFCSLPQLLVQKHFKLAQFLQVLLPKVHIWPMFPYDVSSFKDSFRTLILLFFYSSQVHSYQWFLILLARLKNWIGPLYKPRPLKEAILLKSEMKRDSYSPLSELS